MCNFLEASSFKVSVFFFWWLPYKAKENVSLRPLCCNVSTANYSLLTTNWNHMNKEALIYSHPLLVISSQYLTFMLWFLFFIGFLCIFKWYKHPFSSPYLSTISLALALCYEGISTHHPPGSSAFHFLVKWLWLGFNKQGCPICPAATPTPFHASITLNSDNQQTAFTSVLHITSVHIVKFWAGYYATWGRM